ALPPLPTTSALAPSRRPPPGFLSFPTRRSSDLGLAIDSTVDIFTFYVPHRHVYGEQWIKFMKDGVNATPLPTESTVHHKRDDEEIGRAVQQECRDRALMPSCACSTQREATNVVA